VIRSFRDRGTADVFDGSDTKAARGVCPRAVWRVARRKLDQLNAAVSRDSLRFPPGNRWEKLTGDREGQDAIRINDQYRICYTWTAEGPAWVEITDYH
jgi:toxin HigB-1